MGNRRAIPLMIQGTSSDAGKSLLATAFCRIFAEMGYKTAPFKSQNMSLNSYVTPDGKEIGRAQGVQAEAAGTAATTDMNPILIKPSGDRRAQIVVHGKPIGDLEAAEYRENYYPFGLKVIQAAYDNLASEYDRIVIEGAGSPAEVNLNDRELVNMRVARMTGAPVLLVADIDRGGVFASLVGTLQLLDPSDRDRVIGVIINKFRGDLSLLQPGLDWFTSHTGKPVLGVVPYLDHLYLDSEDSLATEKYKNLPNMDSTAEIKSAEKKDAVAEVDGEVDREADAKIDIAVLRYPRISNFTDIDPFLAEQDCRVRFVSRTDDLGQPDLLILPGSKNTMEDLKYLRETGLEQAILSFREQHPHQRIIGICGGYQMLGRTICDPCHVESDGTELEGLGLIPMETTLQREKTTVLSEGILTFDGRDMKVKGYEIHMGQSRLLPATQAMTFDQSLPAIHQTASIQPLIQLGDRTDGVRDPGLRLLGTYFHGIFHNDEFRHALLQQIRRDKNLPSRDNRVSFNSLREESYRRLAEHVRQYIKVDWIHDQMMEFYNRNQA